MSLEQPIRIVIAYAHREYASSLKLLLESRETFRVVGEAYSRQDAVAMVEHTRPEVAIVSLGLSGLDGFETVRALRRVAPNLGVILVTDLAPDHLNEKAENAGALALLPISQVPYQIFAAVESVREQRRFFRTHCDDVLAH